MITINEFIAFIIFEICYLGLMFYIFYITASPTLDNAVKIAKVLDIDLNKLKVGD